MPFSTLFSSKDSETQETAQELTLRISGMKCAGCAQSIERQLLRQAGVASATVNLITEKATVEFIPALIQPDQLVESLTDSGFQTQILNPTGTGLSERQTPIEADSENSSNVWQLWFAVSLVLFSGLGHLEEMLPISIPVIGTMTGHFLLATLALVGPGASIITSGTGGLLRNRPTMDTLVSMGSVTSYSVSVIALLFPRLGWDCFFDAPVMIIGLILLGRTLERQARARAKSSFQSLLSLQSQVAYVFPSESSLEAGLNQGNPAHPIPIEQVQSGDRLQVLTGDHFPVDGEIVWGHTLVDESMLTGESLPVAKGRGAIVSAGTMNLGEGVMMEASRTGSETTLAKIIRLVETAQTKKAPIQGLADTVAGYFTYGVMAIATLTFLFWWLWGTKMWPELILELNGSPMHDGMMTGMSEPEWGSVLVSLKLAIAVLVIACPCALGLATPTAILVGTSIGAERGLILNGGDVLEKCHHLKTIVFDKTGTLTEGTLAVTDRLLPEHRHPEVGSDQDLLRWMASVEQSSRHPLSVAILKSAEALDLHPIENLTTFTGSGLSGSCLGHSIWVGSQDWIEAKGVPLSEIDLKKSQSLMKQGKTVIFCAIDQQFAGMLALQDALRGDAKSTLETLAQMGLNIQVLTGDRLENTAILLQELNLSANQINANLSPEQKADRIAEFQRQGPVAMVGDGINDSPALAQADVGIALSSGTDVAMETAQIVLTRSQVNGNAIALKDIVQAIRLSQSTFRKIKQNLFWAFAYNLIGIPVAAGFLLPTFHTLLSPSAAAALMACSSVSVIGNSLWLQSQWRSE